MVKIWEYEDQKELKIEYKFEGKERFNSMKGPIKALSKIWFYMPIYCWLEMVKLVTQYFLVYIFELHIAS